MRCRCSQHQIPRSIVPRCPPFKGRRICRALAMADCDPCSAVRGLERNFDLSGVLRAGARVPIEQQASCRFEVTDGAQLHLGPTVRALKEASAGLHANRAVRVLRVAPRSRPPKAGMFGEQCKRPIGIASEDDALDDHGFASCSNCDKATSQKLSMNSCTARKPCTRMA